MSSKNDIDDVSINTDRIIEKNDNQSIITSGEDILSFLNIDFDTLQVALDNFKQANDKLEICLQTSFGSRGVFCINFTRGFYFQRGCKKLIKVY